MGAFVGYIWRYENVCLLNSNMLIHYPWEGGEAYGIKEESISFFSLYFHLC